MPHWYTMSLPLRRDCVGAGKRPVKLGRVEPTRKWRLETADAVAGGAATFLHNAWFSMAHDLIAMRFLWRPQLLTRVSSPPCWRGLPRSSALACAYRQSGQRRMYYVCHTSSYMASVTRRQSGSAARRQRSPERRDRPTKGADDLGAALHHRPDLL